MKSMRIASFVATTMLLVSPSEITSVSLRLWKAVSPQSTMKIENKNFITRYIWLFDALRAREHCFFIAPTNDNLLHSFTG
jgi:hypothetical protein